MWCIFNLGLTISFKYLTKRTPFDVFVSNLFPKTKIKLISLMKIMILKQKYFHAYLLIMTTVAITIPWWWIDDKHKDCARSRITMILLFLQTKMCFYSQLCSCGLPRSTQTTSAEWMWSSYYRLISQVWENSYMHQ